MALHADGLVGGEVRRPPADWVDQNPAQFHAVEDSPIGFVSVVVLDWCGDHVLGLQEVNTEGGGVKPRAVGWGLLEFRED